MKRMIAQVEPDANAPIISAHPKAYTGGEDVHCDFLNTLTTMRCKKDEKIKECYEHIRNHWKEEYYQTCRKQWDQIQPFISETETKYQCSGCKTYWTKITFVNDVDGICPCCDTCSQPFLCNPKNAQYVLKYIDPKYYPYIFPIYQEFKELDDTQDIFQYTKEDPQYEDILLCIKERGEYGISVRLYFSDGEEYMRIFVNLGKNTYSSTPFWFSTFEVEGKGLSEKIYSNRSEYYWNGQYYSNKIDDKIEFILKEINHYWIEERLYPKLLEFIEQKIEIGEKQLCLFPFGEVEDAYLNEFNYRSVVSMSYINNLRSCDSCHTFEVGDNICDFCDRCYCDACCPDEISFKSCDTCGKKWCYYDGRYTDHRCEKIGIRSGSCNDCGL
jgi:hypothetical protein